MASDLLFLSRLALSQFQSLGIRRLANFVYVAQERHMTDFEARKL